MTMIDSRFRANARHIYRCSTPVWFPLFQRDTLKTRVLSLSDEFVEYLNQDGILLPQELAEEGGLEGDTRVDDDDGPSEMGLDQDGNPDGIGAMPSFPELSARIRDVIEEFGGQVFCKLNWSAPTDAHWIMADGSLRCREPADVYLLLKSSDFITHDLRYAYQHCTESDDLRTSPPVPRNAFSLVLRKWYNLHPAMEFRCFVLQNQLVAACQRDHRHFYPFLLASRTRLRQEIQRFWEEHIRHRFFPNEEDSYTFDIYLTREGTADNETGVQIARTWLLDFNPVLPETDPLLFRWEELFEMASSSSHPSAVNLRLVESEKEAWQCTSLAPRFSANMLPQEAFSLDAASGNVSLMEWLTTQQQEDEEFAR